MTDDPTLPHGEAVPLIDGRYRPVRLLGKGGFGEVHLVEDTLQSDELLALKLILARHAESQEFERRFRNEIRVLRSLHHEGIPQIFNDGRTPEGAYYFTMAYVEGRPLDHVLGKEGTLPPLRVARIVRQLVSVLEYAHARGVVHRDLKPGNVLVVGEGTEDERIRVLDFGIAKILGREGPLERAVTMDTMGPIGTPHYMSPEQVRGRDVDGATDYFALGVMIYHMVTGAFPYGGTTLHEMLSARLTDPPTPLPPGVAPPWLARVIEKLLERDRAKRASASDVTAALTAGLAGLMTEQRRHRKWLAGIAAAVVVLGVGVGSLLLRERSDDAPTGETERAGATVAGDARDSAARTDVSSQSPAGAGQSPTANGDDPAALEAPAPAAVVQDTGDRATTGLAPAPTKPRIEVLTRELRTSESSLDLELRITAEHLERVTFDGIVQDFDASGRFTVPLELRRPGKTRYTVSASDRSGQSTTEVIEVERVAALPRLMEIEPRDGTRLDAGVERVAVSAMSSEPLAGVTIAGVAATVDAADPRRFRADVPLALGDNAFEVVLESEFGTRAASMLTLTRATPPVPAGFAAVAEEGLRDGHFARIVHEDLGLELVLLPPVRVEIEDTAYDVTRPVYVGRHEVTAAQYEQFCERAGRARPSGSDRKGSEPVTHITHDDALAFCRLYGFRLLTEAEWLCAARGADDLEYPWGPEWREGAANVRDGGDGSVARIDDPRFATDVSWCGVAHLAGNVSERIDGELVIGGAYRLVRDSARSRPANPNNRPLANASVGFRVALDATSH